ncbi:hypothetical protein ACFLZM_01955 [Thermodesulfobacteriota bacterium]
MKENIGFNEIEIGMPLGVREIDVTKEAVDFYMEKSLWDSENFAEQETFAPPGIFNSDHVRMLTAALGGAGDRIWAKSNHQYIKPIRIGAKLKKTGNIADKYIKRGKQYLVYEVETRDENGNLIIKSRETSFFGPVGEGGKNES